MADEKNSRSKNPHSGDFKRGSAEIISDLLSEGGVKRVREYVKGEEFRADRQRIREGASQRIRNLKDRYRSRNRTPEDAAKERDLTLRLAEVEAEAAELRIRLSELLEEEEKLRTELRDLD